MSVRKTKLFIGFFIAVLINFGIAFALYRYIQSSASPQPQRVAPVSSLQDLNYTPVNLSAEPLAPASSASSNESAQGDYLEIPPDKQPEAALPDVGLPSVAVFDPAQSAGISASNGRTVQGAELVADVAVEADYEFYAHIFRGNLIEATNYISTLIGAVSDIYARDIHVRLRPTFIRISTTPVDVWTATTSAHALTEVRNYWTAHEGARKRAVVLFLSGRDLGGGLAYRNGLCSADFGYAVISGIKGTFTPYPSAKTWDLVAVAHELGHVFGSRHSFCYKRADAASDEWYDECYSGPESAGCYSGPVKASNGTLMSYCYVTGGSMERINPISFSNGDPVMINVMRQTAENALAGNASGCLNYATEAMPRSGQP